MNTVYPVAPDSKDQPYYVLIYGAASYLKANRCINCYVWPLFLLIYGKLLFPPRYNNSGLKETPTTCEQSSNNIDASLCTVNKQRC